MRYIVDGYNFLFRTSGKQASLEKKRQILLDLFNEQVATIGLNVCLVFDSSEKLRAYAQRSQLDSLEVIYPTCDQTADDYIVEMVEHCKHPATMTIVTSDTGLARRCSRLGAKTQSIKTFIAFIEKKQVSRLKKKAKTPFKDTNREIMRLLQIFE